MITLIGIHKFIEALGYSIMMPIETDRTIQFVFNHQSPEKTVIITLPKLASDTPEKTYLKAVEKFLNYYNAL